jgi:hypothetical protein
MGVAIISVVGLCIMVIVPSYLRYLAKLKAGKDPALEQIVAELGKRVSQLELQLQEKDAKIDKLETDLVFVGKLLEDKSKQ